MQSGVYFVGARHPKFGPVIKIGVATSISHRLAQLNYYGFVPLRLLAVELMPRDEAAWREKELHRAFSQQRVCGEWFVDRDPLSSFVRNIETLVEREKGEVA